MRTTTALMRGGQLLGCLFLIMSHSAIIVRAQAVTIGQTTPPTNMTDQAVAQLLSKVFNDISADLGTIGRNATQDMPTSTSDGSMELKDAPNLLRLLNNSASPDELRAALLAQQSVGNLQPLENAASTVAAFLDLPATFGTGVNIQAFLDRVQQLKGTRDQVKQYLGIDTLQRIDGYLNTATSLVLSFVAGFPLAELAYLTATIALGAAITGLIAGIFYTVGSALAIAASIPGIVAAQRNSADAAELAAAAAAAAPARSSASPARTIINEPWLNDLKVKSLKLQLPILTYGFSAKPLGALQIADAILGMADTGLTTLADATTALG